MCRLIILVLAKLNNIKHSRRHDIAGDVIHPLELGAHGRTYTDACRTTTAK